MVVIPRKRSTGPKPSKCLPKKIENELRILVFDAVDEFRPIGGKAPEIIIGNTESGCHGLCFHKPDGTQFVFHHTKMQFATECKCLVPAAPGDGDKMTYQLPQNLDRYRIRLIRGRNVPFRLEPRLAAMVVMKLFLGMAVPEPLRLKALATVDKPAMGADKQAEETDPSLDKQETDKQEEDEQQEDKIPVT
ncbi:hypothetical protein HD806DRAFT_539664 [Xylariaceae sp. AK1471]|nr:hypothetical protein HD806DRAFT_539664 [Xylariaceae sp. AK1471]